MRRWRWVSRDRSRNGGKSSNREILYIWHDARQPGRVESEGYWWWQGTAEYLEMCEKRFKKLFGFTIDPGECVKVEFRAKKLKA